MTQIIAFEGLHPLLIPWLVPSYVKRGLLDKVEFAGVKLWRGGFMSTGPVRDWDADKVIVIGHSMGGASAIEWCNRKAPKIEIDLLITLDPRPLHRPYIKPANVKRAVNIYQQSWWMPGYPVQGAENILLTDGTGHTGVPAHPLAWKVLSEKTKE